MHMLPAIYHLEIYYYYERDARSAVTSSITTTPTDQKLQIEYANGAKQALVAPGPSATAAYVDLSTF